MSKIFTHLGQGASMRPLSSAPSDPQNGDFYYDSTLLKFRFYQSGAWGSYTSSALAAANIFVGSALGVATGVAMTGDIAIGATGATSYSGTVPINKGGTGAITKPLGFDALSPMSAVGDIIIGGVAGTGTRLAGGANTWVLTMVTGSPAWVDPNIPPTIYDNGSSAAAATINWANSVTQKILMTNNCTFTFSNPVVGEMYLLKLLQNGTGNWINTWPANVKWPSSVTPTPSGANKADIYSFFYDGTYFYGNASLTYL